MASERWRFYYRTRPARNLTFSMLVKYSGWGSCLSYLRVGEVGRRPWLQLCWRPVSALHVACWYVNYFGLQLNDRIVYRLNYKAAKYHGRTMVFEIRKYHIDNIRFFSDMYNSCITLTTFYTHPWGSIVVRYLSRFHRSSSHDCGSISLVCTRPHMAVGGLGCTLL